MANPTVPLRPVPTPTELPRAHYGSAETSRTSVLLYGVPKVGKTHNALTFDRPLVLAACCNTLTLELTGHPALLPSTWGDSWAGFRSRILPVLKAREAHKLLGRDDAKPEDVQTIVLDELNTLVKLLEDSITAGDPGRKWTHADFGRLGGELSPVIRDLAGLKTPRGSLPRYNFIATCHVRDVNDAEGNMTAVQAQIMGGTRDIIAAYFDLVLLLTKETTSVINPTTKLPERRVEFYAYSAPPTQYHNRLGLGGSVGPSFPARLLLTGKTTLRDTILQQLAPSGTSTPTNT